MLLKDENRVNAHGQSPCIVYIFKKTPSPNRKTRPPIVRNNIIYYSATESDITRIYYYHYYYYYYRTRFYHARAHTHTRARARAHAGQVYS